MFVPFKAVVGLDGVKGVLMAYSEFDGVPCSLNRILYKALNDWGFNGYINADDGGTFFVPSSVRDTIAQWHNSGRMVQYYDFPIDSYITVTVDITNNGTLAKSTLQLLAKKILGVKYDLGLFDNRFIPEDVDSEAIPQSHVPLVSKAA